ncbi:hypothetical protein [Kushneria marisflavi]|uniref:Uncharacterized protein n=1 Tax=Kushneria marisflavi TaxID=157779 RepID=A0A240ULT4_9GAMM|nr:hypothetical protein [Kushneria marisflavi]ART62086.1 hypothetical protein B9H00_02525 [Kushneria marisflavi]RKD87158.1 hypothetical protein C8D96_0616 [Kushneria marisflavi]
MISLLWIAFLAIILGGYGLWRGFSRDICLSVMLIALGVAAGALIIISSVGSLLMAGVLVVASLGVCLREGMREIPKPQQGRAQRQPARPLAPSLPDLWQANIRMRRAPRQGATPRRRSRQIF